MNGSRRWTAVAAASAAVLAAACAPVYSGPPAARAEAPAVPRDAGRTAAGSPRSADGGETARLAAVLGTLVWPLATDRAAVVGSAYGDRAHPHRGDVRFHGGLDLRASAGTPVYAAADGVVVASGAAGAYGNRILLDHGAGLVSLYAHHSRNLVAAGTRVRRGQIIALVGRTGNATGDHLHFELRWRDGTVDPRTVLPLLDRSR